MLVKNILNSIYSVIPLTIFGEGAANQVSAKESALVAKPSSVELGEQKPSQALSSSDFLLKNYDDIAIETDLETDDVAALERLFREANRIYAENPEKKYPIDLIVVGEGNTAIKKMRMEKMIAEYFDVPADVNIQVVEGKANPDNIFPYDGEELFDKETLQSIPFPSPESNVGAAALRSWASRATKPMIVQLKPAQEVLAFSEDKELSKKTSIFFYGGFNLRKTAEDPELFPGLSVPAAMKALFDKLSERFEKVAILEGFAVLGEQNKVSKDIAWTQRIAKLIENSDSPFITVFRDLSDNWNRSIFNSMIKGCGKVLGLLQDLERDETLKTKLGGLKKEMSQLKEEWNEEKFRSIFTEVADMKKLDWKSKGDETLKQWKTLIRKIELADKVAPGSGVQFTFADIAVAMAACDDKLFTATPSALSCDETGYLKATPDANSNIVYYNATNPEEFGKELENLIQAKIDADNTSWIRSWIRV